MSTRNPTAASPAFAEPFAFAIGPLCPAIESALLQPPCAIIRKSSSALRVRLSNHVHPLKALYRHARMPFRNP